MQVERTFKKVSGEQVSSIFSYKVIVGGLLLEWFSMRIETGIDPWAILHVNSRKNLFPL